MKTLLGYNGVGYYGNRKNFVTMEIIQVILNFGIAMETKSIFHTNKFLNLNNNTLDWMILLLKNNRPRDIFLVKNFHYIFYCFKQFLIVNQYYFSSIFFYCWYYECFLCLISGKLIMYTIFYIYIMHDIKNHFF